MSWIERWLGRGCPLCGGPLDAPGVCVACQETLIPWVGPKGMALGPYARLRGLVHAVKYRGDRVALEVAVRRLARVSPPGMTEARIAYVPTFFWRRLRRPFYLPAELALGLGKAWGWRVEPVLLRRRYTPSQTRVRSRGGLPQVFLVKRRITGAWLLVDDVLTSGATFARAREALLGAGAEAVYGVFLAVRDKKSLGL